MITLGADGCAAGWICAVRCDQAPLDMAVFGHFDELLAAWPGAIVAADMPIGLMSSGSRDCDLQARARLGPRRSSVFPAPLRICLAATCHAEASAARRGVDQKGISAQVWNIVAKIREVDAVISPTLQDRILEAHPELAFAEMNGGRPFVESKKTAEGRTARQIALRANLAGAQALLDRRRPSGVAADDLLDAMATLWTADRYVAGAARRVPAEPALDDRGLRMEIWF